jgi:hypothetical protein
MSVSALWRAGLAAALLAFAIAIIVAKSGALMGGYDAVYADNALRAATQAEKGPARDKALAEALHYVDAGLEFTPNDPRLWGSRAEALLRQALVASETARPKLLSASVQASTHAAAYAPNDSSVQARLALVLALAGERKTAAAALTRSYDLDIASNVFGHRRLEAAGRAWPELDAAGQRSVANEACVLASRGASDRARMQRLRFGAADPGLALALDQILADGACRGAEG